MLNMLLAYLLKFSSSLSHIFYVCMVLQCRIWMYFGTTWAVCVPKKNVPKKILLILFPYIFRVKFKWNIVYEYLQTKFSLRNTNIFPKMHWTSNIFGLSATTIVEFGYMGISKLSNPWLQENGIPKKRLDGALSIETLSAYFLSK